MEYELIEFMLSNDGLITFVGIVAIIFACKCISEEWEMLDNHYYRIAKKSKMQKEANYENTKRIRKQKQKQKQIQIQTQKKTKHIYRTVKKTA